jgi:hypothetical protein
MIIYKLTNKITGKQYIGQTVKSMAQRWRIHCSPTSGCTYLSHAINKYGQENFLIEIVEHCNSLDELNKKEQDYIKLFNTLSPNGYNLTTGGENCLASQETKDKQSAAHTGSLNAFFGKKHTKESRDKLSKALKGREISLEARRKMSITNTGKKRTKEARANMSKAQKGLKKPPGTGEKIRQSKLGKKASEETKAKMSIAHTGLTHTEETRQKISKIHKGKIVSEESRKKMSASNACKKSIICNETKQVYESVTAAAKAIGALRSAISRMLRGKSKTCKGYTFSYL